MNRHRATGFTIVELLVVVAVIALLVSILLPAIGEARDSAQVNASRSNLRQMGVAHKMYAADWADRHVTYVRDNLGLYGGDVRRYSEEMYDSVALFDGHPPIIAGRGWTVDGQYVYYGQSPVYEGYTVFQPINFPGPPYPGSWVDGAGWFLIGHRAQPMNVYLNGRWHDPIFWPPKDRIALARFEPCFEVPGEYVGDASNQGIGPDGCRGHWTLSGYGLSPAGLFSPDVFSLNPETGERWRPPWRMAAGYRVPSFGQVRYPTLKTHMLEHHWLQNMKVPCNDAFTGCEPYYFNHSYQSMPATLFYDGSVRLMGVLEAMSSDRRHERQAGHGLWSRDTPFGEGGYLIASGYDFAATSFHILTTDGVRGRDTLGRE